MFTNNDIRILINTVANKSREGIIALDKFNNLLQAETRNYFDLHLRMFDRDWKSQKTLRPLTVEKNELSMSGSASYAGIGSDIAHIIEMRSDSGNFIEEIRNTGVWYDRLDKVIKAPSTEYPIGRLQAGSIEIKPDGVGLEDIIYIKYPDDPYLDGYVDEFGVFNYVEEGGNSDDATAELISGNTGTSNSQTKEMKFEFEDKIEIAGMMLSSLGIAYNKQSLFQYTKMVNE